MIQSKNNMDGQGYPSMQHNEQVMEKYRELRKANVKLLEERRELLLQLQHAKRADHQEDYSPRLSETCENLKTRIKDLEKQLEETNRQLDVSKTIIFCKRYTFNNFLLYLM